MTQFDAVVLILTGLFMGALFAAIAIGRGGWR